MYTCIASGLAHATGVDHPKLHFIPLLRILYSTSDYDENLHKLQEAKLLLNRVFFLLRQVL